MSTSLERLPASSYIQEKEDLGYMDWLNLHGLFDLLAFTGAVILNGPKGAGKSLAVASWAAKNKLPIVTFDCSEDVRRAHMYGSYIMRGNETPFVLGPVPTAISIANECGKCVLNLEEINTLTPQMQKLLNPLTDWRSKIEMPEAKTVFKLNPEAKLWVVGSMTLSAHSGIYELNDDLKSRCRFVDVGYPTKKQETAILERANETLQLDAGLIEKTITLAAESRSGTYGYMLSPRDNVQFLEDVKLCGLETGLWLLAAKFEGTNKETVLRRIQSTFDCKPKPLPVNKTAQST